jgi:hypothetical protein
MWVAYNENDEEVLAADADGDSEYYCPDCDDSVWHKESHTRSKPSGGETHVSAHFGHQTQGHEESCGESDLHRKLKSIATSDLSDAFSDVLEDAYTEDHPQKATKVVESSSKEQDIRQPDAVLEFERNREKRRKFGKGLFVEIQVSNKNKDTEATTEDYIRNEWSVVWLSPEDFTEDTLDAEIFLDLEDDGDNWHTTFPQVMQYRTPQNGTLFVFSGMGTEEHDDRYIDLYYPEYGLDHLSWSSETPIDIKMPPEAVARLVEDGWSRMFEEPGGSVKIPEEIDVREFGWVQDVIDRLDESIEDQANYELGSWIETSSKAYYELKKAWRRGVRKEDDSPRELLRKANYTEKKDAEGITPEVVYDMLGSQVQSVWHAVGEDEELAIECDGVIFRDFSGFEEYYSDEYRDIDPFGKESLENAELRKIES